MEQENLLTTCKQMLEETDRDVAECIEESAYMQGIRHMFMAYAWFNNLEPDTLEGDTITRELYDCMTANDYVSYHDFDLWLWSNLT